MTLIPWGYGTQYKRLDDVRTILLVHYHPEYVRRLCAWLEHQGGVIGIGGTWRDDGTQPDRPGFAPEGKSFHQNQRYADGFIGATAVDLVRVDGPDGNHSHDGVSWADVPAQGSDEATAWGIHANVGVPGTPGSEAWHIQPVEIDGYDTWVRDGQPAPAPNYPIPGIQPPAPQPFGDDDMLFIARNSANGAIHLTNGVLRRYAPDAEGIVKASAAAGQPVRDLATGQPVKNLGDVTGVPGAVIAASGLAIDEATKD